MSSAKQKTALEVARAAEKLARKTAKTAELLAANAAKAGVPLTKDDIEEIVKKTIVTTLTSLGIVAHNDEQIAELRKDFEYTRAWRQAIQKGTKTGWITFVTVSVTGLLGALYIGVRMVLTGHP